ncbi:MAG TPA: DUF6519 domain-containing protein [Pyrinomonadaceae bacterium]|jgi:hypothetical protein|nr:DUF6519 domain-containing protein [Pyrinomonadaceae bacterium]
MKNDSSRNTFDARKHFSGVRAQQGRVQIDADWNEQSDIITHRVETEASDIIGPCGGPLHSAAFHIVADINQLTNDEKALAENRTPPKDFKVPDFLISAGCYYVDGILCENEGLTSYRNQPDLPASAPIAAAGLYLVYLDVWRRHLTALDDASIREIALGGPDTATRAKTLWQVKCWFAGETAKGNCLTKFADYDKLIAASDGRLSARTKREAGSTDPCIVPPGAGYSGLENQHYRVEIHEGGAGLDVTGGGAGTLATRVKNSTDQVRVSGGTWQAGQAVEIFSSKAGSGPMNGTLAYITNFDSGSKTLTLNIDVSKITLDELRLRDVAATFKWSRDNGVVATTILNINGPELTVHDLGPDDVLGFKEGQWVELIDDALELNGSPGQLARIIRIDPAINLVTLSFTPALLSTLAGGVDQSRHPKLRRWDGVGAVKFHPNVAQDHYMDLESGVQVRFFAGTFRTGDYWNIPARTATADSQSGNIEWPQESNAPLALPPFGIEHHYCRLAMLHWDGRKFDLIEDCRSLFPPITELTSLFYVGGGGQEAMPNDALPQLLQVGVFNGRWPVAGAHVQFKAQGTGRLAANIAGLSSSTTNTLVVITGADGIASCAWKLEPDVTKPSQQVETRLLDAAQVQLPPVVRFDGQLSIADQVFYDPGACGTLQGQTTVQKALSRLTHLTSLYKLSGDGQEFKPGETLAPLKVIVANSCGPVTDRKVRVTFQIVAPGTGTVSDGSAPDSASIDITTDADGVATCLWKPDSKSPFQEVEATIKDDGSTLTVTPTGVRFNATLSIAGHVAFDRSDNSKCPDMPENVNNVQAAIEHLCNFSRSGGCAVTVGMGGQFERLDDAIGKMLVNEQTNICICLLPGEHVLKEGLNIAVASGKVHLNIEGCGRGTRIIIPHNQSRPKSSISGLASFTLKDVALFAQAAIAFDMCKEINIEDCYLVQENQTAPFITIGHARRIQFEDNVVYATLPIAENPTSPIEVFSNVSLNLSELYKIPDSFEFERRSSEVATELVGQPAAKRNSLVRKLTGMVSKFRRLSAGERTSYNSFMETLGDPAVAEPLLHRRLGDIRLAALAAMPGTAIVLADAEADTRLEGNTINGVVSLYGAPRQSKITEENMRILSENIHQGMIEFDDSLADLQVRDNIIYRMDISESLATILKSININSRTSFNRHYRRCFITDNVFNGGDNCFLMEHLSLNTNSFELNRDKDGVLDAGIVIAHASINIGNYAANELRLVIIARARQRAANLSIYIAEL